MGGLLYAGMAGAAQPAAKVIADMESLPRHVVSGRHGSPVVSLANSAASGGQKSLRIEYDGRENDQCMVGFHVDGSGGGDALAFDLYVERDNGANLVVDMTLDASDDQGGRFRARLNLPSFIDGWAPVLLSLNGGFKYSGGAKPDWNRIRRVGFWLDGQMAGKAVLYLDNLRFESLGAAAKNLLYNSSFEIATNPDVPDGWTRDLNLPPYGREVWSIDTNTAFHGGKSLRIGRCGKYARSWDRHTYVQAGDPYTFSVCLKSDQPGVRVKFHVRGVGEAIVEADTEWRRYHISGRAQAADTVAFIRLVSEGTLWVDAAQLEAGETPTEYLPAAADGLAAGIRVPKRRSLTAKQRQALDCPSFSLSRARQPPAIDGDLNDACWQDAAVLTNFVQLQENAPATPPTAARMVYDGLAIYFAVRAEEPDPPAVAKLVKSLRRPPWGGDLADLFIDLHHDRETYYHFAANAAGARYAGRHTSRDLFDGEPSAWRCEWQAAGRFDDTGWTVEAAIPYTCFDLRPDLGVSRTLGVNICRENPRTQMHSSWAYAYGGFHTPQAFGEAHGFDADLSRYRVLVADLAWSRGVASACVQSGETAARRFTAVFSAEAPGGARVEGTAVLDTVAGQTVRVECPLPLDQNGAYAVVLRLADDAGAVYVSQPLAVTVSGAALLDVPGPEFDFYTSEPAARVRCLINASAQRCRALRLRWRMESGAATGGAFVVRNPTPGLNEWQAPLAGLPRGAHRFCVQLVEDGRVLAEQARPLRILPPAAHTVRINRWGRFLVCDGEPLLAYGFYNNLNKGDEASWCQALDLMQAAGCNTLLNYYYENVGWMLDRAAERNLKLWVHLGWMLSYWIPKYEGWSGKYESREAATNHLREVVLKYRDHPALLGWLTLDEPGNRPELFTPEYVSAAYRLIKELDPHHPCAFSHLTRPGEAASYGPSTDVAIMPFVARDSHADSLFREFWEAGLPIIVNRPCFGALAGAVREPTPAEVRLAIYKAVILGARGSLAYTFRCAAEGAWNEFGAVARELDVLRPALLGDGPACQVAVSPESGDVHAMTCSADQREWLVAVNTAPEPRAVLLQPAEPAGLRAAVAFFGAPPAVVNPGARAIAVTLPPSGTAVYALERMPGDSTGQAH